MIRAVRSFIYPFLIFVFASTAHANPCGKKFLTTANVNDALEAYLTELFQSQAITESEIQNLIESIRTKSIATIISRSRVMTNYQAQTHRQELQKFLNDPDIDWVRIMRWAEKQLKSRANAIENTHHLRTQTSEALDHIEFHPIAPAKFLLGEPTSPLEVNLTHHIEVMTTPVTQEMWMKEMTINPSHKKDPDYPVESITWWSAIVFANRLSERMKLNPAYDVTQIAWRDGTSAEKGDLEPKSQEDWSRLKINAPLGDIYRTQGFRLLTNAEYEYLLKNRNPSNEVIYPHGLNPSQILNYAWCSENSNGTTQMVGTTPQSLRINGKDFSDLIGNVWQWVHDYHSNRDFGGKNPQGPKSGTMRLLRGGSFQTSAELLTASSSIPAPPESKRPNTGFRLARTIR